MKVIEHSIGKGVLVGPPLIALALSGLAITFALQPNGTIVLDPLDKLRKFSIPATTVWSFAISPTLSFATRIDDLIRVGIGRITMTKSEYKQVLNIMKKWNMDLAELCRYSIMSVIEAHLAPHEIETARLH
jgi:hypothetical protein